MQSLNLIKNYVVAATKLSAIKFKYETETYSFGPNKLIVSHSRFDSCAELWKFFLDILNFFCKTGT